MATTITATDPKTINSPATPRRPGPASAFRPAAVRIWLPALALLLGVACLLSANDRMAGQSEHVGALGRLSFGPQATVTRAALMLQDRSDDAERLAASALPQEPISLQALDVLGGGAILNGDPNAAYDAFHVAAQLGWRDMATQRYWLLTGLAAGRPDLAVDRLDALLRAQPVSPVEAQALTQFEATPAGRAALVGRMRLAPDWLDSYLLTTRTLSSQAFANRLATIALARQARVGFPLDAAQQLAWQMARDGHATAARTLLAAVGWPGAAAGRLLWEGDFEQVPPAGQVTPFDWRLLSAPGLTVQVEPEAPAPLTGHALHIGYSGSAAEAVAEQTLTLAPGNHRLGWRTDRHAQAVVNATARCSAPAARMLAVTPAAATIDTGAVQFTVPAGCPTQALQLIVAPAHGAQHAGLWIDDVTVDGG